MPEFKKKTALGLRDLPEYGQECTHVLLTHSEYDGLLAKVACAERDARSVYTAASQKIAQAERNSAQAKEAAYAEVDAVQKDLEEACRKNGIEFYHPSPIFCTDNAAMIGVAGYYEYIKGIRDGWDLNAKPNLKIGER